MAKIQVTEIMGEQDMERPTEPIHGVKGSDFPEWSSDMPTDELLKELIAMSLQHALFRSTRTSKTKTSVEAVIEAAHKIRNGIADPIETFRQRLRFDWPTGQMPEFVRMRGFVISFHHCLWQAAYHAFVSTFDNTAAPYLEVRVAAAESRVDILNREGSLESRGSDVQAVEDRTFFSVLNTKMKGAFTIHGPDRLPESDMWRTRIAYHHELKETP